MNDRTRKIAVKWFAVAGSTAAALSVITFGGIQSIPAAALLATLAGTLGHFAFTWLGAQLMKLQKRLSYDAPGGSMYTFGKLPPAEEHLAGGKGRALAKLSQMGFPVPNGFILLPSAFDGDEVSAEAWQTVAQQLARLRRGKECAFAVRSSALNEDSAQASFAGEFESVLDVRSDAEIRAAVQAVRKSRHSARVQSYGQAKGMAGGEYPLAVIIQKFIPADFAGVLFTVDPLSGSLSRMTGNFVAGLGEKLVSGQVSALEFSFERPEGRYHGPAELQPIAKRLHQEAHAIEHDMGSPQDIEWAVASGKLFILQARPITTLNGFDPVTAQWNDSLQGNFLWSATNLMEACPQVQTPFTASLRPYLEKNGGPSLTVKNYPLNGIIGGRFYANITVQVSAFVYAFKGDARRAYREIAGWWGDLPEDLDIPLLPLTKQEWQREVLPMLWRTNRLFARYRKQAPAFLAQNRQRCADLRKKAQTAGNKAELLALWNNEISIHYRDAMIHIVAAGSDIQVRLERELRELVGPEDANALLSNLSGQSNQLESMGPMAGLGMVARGQMSREAYLENYGHRGANEAECAWPRPMEDPAWLDRQLAEWQRNPVDIEAMLARQRSVYEAAWSRYCQKYPGKIKTMWEKLAKARKAAQQRELARSEGTRGITVLRAFALRAGELLGIGEDVFFLTIEEVLEALAGEASACRYLPTRKEAHQRLSELPPYPAIIRGRFDPFTWAADPNRRSDRFDAQAQVRAPAVSAEASIIKGIPGALGVVEGTVRRLDSLEESHLFQPGEVLVTTMTNIGWTPLFPRSAAIVTDLGAPLSHAAIVARELGIPAVVGCGDATMRLATGDRVRVDGGSGLVEILTASPEDGADARAAISEDSLDNRE